METRAIFYNLMGLTMYANPGMTREQFMQEALQELAKMSNNN